MESNCFLWKICTHNGFTKWAAPLTGSVVTTKAPWAWTCTEPVETILPWTLKKIEQRRRGVRKLWALLLQINLQARLESPQPRICYFHIKGSSTAEHIACSRILSAQPCMCGMKPALWMPFAFCNCMLPPNKIHRQWKCHHFFSLVSNCSLQKVTGFYFPQHENVWVIFASVSTSKEKPTCSNVAVFHPQAACSSTCLGPTSWAR